jgi:hypothetical protein
MEKVVLQFPSIVELIDFSLAMNSTEFEVDRRNNVLIADLPPEDIELAKTFSGVKTTMPSKLQLTIRTHRSER